MQPLSTPWYGPGWACIAGLQGFEEFLGHVMNSPVNLEDCYTHLGYELRTVILITSH